MVRAEPIARYLVRFDIAEDEAPPSFMILPEPAIDPEVIAATAREAGHAEGYEAGFAAAEAEAGLARTKAEADYELRLEGERALWVVDESQSIMSALACGFEALTLEIAHCVEQILRPFLAVALREKALADLAVSLARLGEDGPLMRITGPADLIGALRAADTLPRRTLDLCVEPGVDVKAVAQPTIIETRIGAWMQRLQIGGEQAAGV